MCESAIDTVANCKQYLSLFSDEAPHIDQAVHMKPHSLDRILNVAAFSLSAYSGVRRTCKPFNALMGETYELACPEKGFRFLAEKVCPLPGRALIVHHCPTHSEFFFRTPYGCSP